MLPHLLIARATKAGFPWSHAISLGAHGMRLNGRTTVVVPATFLTTTVATVNLVEIAVEG